jgi:hypothetical protein
VEKYPSLQGNLGQKNSKHWQLYYPVSTNEIAPPRSIDGNSTFNFEQCRETVHTSYKEHLSEKIKVHRCIF